MTSKNLGISPIRTLFPAPVAPRMATHSPGFTSRVMSRSTGSRLPYSKETSSKRTMPSRRGRLTASGADLTSIGASRISKTRFAPIRDCWTEFTIAATLFTWPANCSRRPAKTTRPAPSGSWPRTTSAPP